MCVQCMGAAAAVVGSSAGIRAVLAARSPRWLTPRRLKLVTAALLTVAVAGSGITVG